jgi:hypothetical protein
VIPLEPLPVILVIVFGLIYLIVDEFHEYFKLNNSLIAGSSLAYFFLVVLPEISAGIPVLPLHLQAFEYIFVLLGFITVHLSEKLIMQKIEQKAKEKVRFLIQREHILEKVEHNLITKDLRDDIYDSSNSIEELREIAQVIIDLHLQEEKMEEEIDLLKIKIHDHINEDMDRVRWISTFIYHIIIGLILYALFLSDLIVDGVLFFIFAMFMAVVSIRYSRQVVIPDIDIAIEYKVNPKKKLLSASGVLIGSIIALILGLFIPFNLELIYLVFSFISGVILYPIVRDIIPESESGKPFFFFLGVVILACIIGVIRYLQHHL